MQDYGTEKHFADLRFAEKLGYLADLRHRLSSVRPHRERETFDNPGDLGSDLRTSQFKTECIPQASQKIF